MSRQIAQAAVTQEPRLHIGVAIEFQGGGLLLLLLTVLELPLAGLWVCGRISGLLLLLLTALELAAFVLLADSISFWVLGEPANLTLIMI